MRAARSVLEGWRWQENRAKSAALAETASNNNATARTPGDLYPSAAILTRRGILAAGLAGTLLGPSPPWLTQAHSRTSLILLWMDGGASHLDTFDPKPEAPPDFRGPFRALRTNVPGLYFCEHLPRLAAMADRLAILRGVSHAETNHSRARNLLMNACLPPAWLNALRKQEAANPASRPDGLCAATGSSAEISSLNPTLDLARQSDCLTFQSACEMAFHQVAAGSPLVIVSMHGWDTHVDAFQRLKSHLLPELDQAFSSLLRNLERSGMLASTLVAWVGEFGRTPQINRWPAPGRDHWSNAMCVVLAGAGIQGGTVVGATDKLGIAAVDRPIHIEELGATMQKVLGVAHPATRRAAPPRNAYGCPGAPLRQVLKR